MQHLVSPNHLHHLALSRWCAAYPDAKLYAAPGLAKKRPDLHIDAQLTGSDPTPETWRGQIDALPVPGSFAMTEVLFFHRRSRTALVCDLVQRFDPQSLSGWQRIVMQLDGMVGPRGSTPREWRATFLRRSAARRARDRAIAWNADRLVIAHGTCAEASGTEVLRTGLRWLG